MLRNIEDFKWTPGTGPAADRKRRREMVEAFAAQRAPEGSDLDFLRQTTAVAATTADRLRDVTSNYKPATDYPGSGLGQKLKTVAQLIAADLGTRIYFVSLGGFDTHSRQEGAHAALVGELSAAIAAFQKDLKGHKLEERVMLATYSEFGRRVKENGSLGTDHGTASQMFVVTPGDKSKAGLIGKHPSLTELDENDDMIFHTDFRAVYATLLEKWLGFPSEPVLGGKFETLDFV